MVGKHRHGNKSGYNHVYDTVTRAIFENQYDTDMTRIRHGYSTLNEVSMLPSVMVSSLTPQFIVETDSWT